MLIHGEMTQHANLNSCFHSEIGTILTKLLPLPYLQMPEEIKHFSVSWESSLRTDGAPEKQMLHFFIIFTLQLDTQNI